jgi:cytochrome c-type biogenesis protein CcmF
MSPLAIGDKESPLENITLVKGLETDMGKYMVTYLRDTLNPRDRKRYYEINFKSKTGDEKFKLYPDIIENNKGSEGVTPNPAAKHYWNRDIFTYLTFLGDPEKIKSQDTSTFRNKSVHLGDTIFYSKGLMVVNNVTVNPNNEKYKFTPSDTAIGLDITVISKEGNRFSAQPLLHVKEGNIYMVPDTVMAQSLILQFSQVKDQVQGLIEVGVKESTSVLDFVTLKAYEFPFINVLWLGVLVMVVGITMSIVQRVKQLKPRPVSNIPRKREERSAIR